MTRALATLLLSGTLALPALAQDAGAKRKQAKKPPVDVLADSALLEKRAREAAEVAERFWRVRDPLELTLTLEVKKVRGDRSDGAPWRPATLTYAADGGTVSIPLQVRTRGIWRLKNCSFPPLRLNIAEKGAKGTLFEGVDKPKMVSVCDNDDRSERYVLQEFQLYRVHGALSEASHGARLARVTYVDAASGKPFMTRWAFLIEEPEAVAARLGGSVIEIKGARGEDLEPRTSAEMGVFQYLIGNADFSISNLHNVELVRVGFGVHVPVAYDFDYAGAVNAHYARPPEVLKLRHVTERVFRGECTPDAELERAVAAARAKRETIYALYRDPVGQLLPPATVKRTLEYFEEFFEETADPRNVRRRIVDACLGKLR